jgi:hypothetical protein
MTFILNYLPLFTIGILAGTAAGITLLRAIRPRFAYSWLLAALGALLTLPLVFVFRPLQPRLLPLANWESLDMMQASPAFLVDGISWSFSLALAALVLAVILTDVARAAESDWSAWAGCLILGAIGLAAVMAGNLVTMLLLWVAVDAIELLVLLWHSPTSSAREQIIAAFTARTGGVYLLWFAGLTAVQAGTELDFEAIPPQVVIYLILAAGLRLGILPLHLPLLHERTLRRGLGTMLRLVPAATSLVLLVRTASAGVPMQQSLILLALAALAAYVASLLWISATDELEGRPFWIMGMASLALAAAVRGQPAASLAWGMALLLSGGMIFLTTARHPRLLPGFLLGLIGFTAFPFTAGWNGARLYADPFSVITLLFLIPQALLLAGYARHTLRSGDSLAGVERWILVIYPVGLFLLPLIHNLAAWLGASAGTGEMTFWGLSSVLPGAATIALAALWWARMRRLATRPERIPSGLRSLLSFNWFYGFVWNMFRTLGRLADLFTTVLEGDGGVLWALLLLTLLLALLVQGAGGAL